MDYPDRLLTIRQVADVLGVSPRTVVRLTDPDEYGVLRAVRVGRSVRVRQSDLSEYLDTLDAVGVA
jgi:excisionase family DNA binding protein